MTTAVRLAIVSTPRTGNNWIQHLLSRVYGVPRFSPVNPANVRWNELPPECVIILHWRRDSALNQLLAEHRFRVLSIARHPLDVLISILHFTLRETTDGWLRGEGGNERAILGLPPRDPRFLTYACGPRAQALLAVSAEWWRDPACVKVRYEEMVDAPQAAMQRLIDAVHLPPRHSLEEAIEATSLPRLRGEFPDQRYHFWQGQPGLWRTLLTADEASTIAKAHAEIFSLLDYSADADSQLTASQADGHWRALLGLEPGDDGALRTLQAAHFEVKRDLERTRHRLAQLEGLGPTALELAGRLKALRERFPRLALLLKRLLGR